jgi:hypothetical protein
MKTINVTFEDADFKRLIEKKQTESWEKFILRLVE